MVKCPACGNPLELGNAVKQGDHVQCPECGELLEVISVKPLELDYAIEGEGWDEEWEEEEEQ